MVLVDLQAEKVFSVIHLSEIRLVLNLLIKKWFQSNLVRYGSLFQLFC